MWSFVSEYVEYNVKGCEEYRPSIGCGNMTIDDVDCNPICVRAEGYVT